MEYIRQYTSTAYQLKHEQFANMCTSVTTLCKQTCDAIVQQQPILAAINKQLLDQSKQLEEQCQQTKLLRQQNQFLQQQVQQLTRVFHNSLPEKTMIISFQKTTPMTTATGGCSTTSKPEQSKNQKR